MSEFDGLPHISESGGFSNTYAQDSGLVDSMENRFVKTKFMPYRHNLETGLELQETGVSYIFMTKPDLNLSGNTGKVGFFDAMQNTPEYESLDTMGTISNFIPIISNMYTSISLEDFNSNESSYAMTYRGFTQRLSTGSGQSKGGGGTLSITYNETADSSITRLHKLWFDYIDYVKFGQFDPLGDYINSRALDYVSSLYYFACRPDGETITMWGKYTGIIPQNVPYSSFGGEVGGRNLVQLSCSYIYNFKEFMETEIISEFNKVAGSIGSINKNFSTGVQIIDGKLKFENSKYSEPPPYATKNPNIITDLNPKRAVIPT